MILPVHEVFLLKDTLSLKPQLLEALQASLIEHEYIGVHLAKVQRVEGVPEHERNRLSSDALTVIAFTDEDSQLAGAVDQVDTPKCDEADDLLALSNAEEHLVFRVDVLDYPRTREGKISTDETTQLRVIAKRHYFRNGLGALQHDEVDELTD